MSGKLYLVGTPIGNLGDISPRAASTLGGVDFIAAEDTRVTLKLLNHLGIKKPLISYHEHNKAGMGEKILARLKNGENGALCTDAGMPCISDPGEELVALCAGGGVEVLVIPGPCAVSAALALSGMGGGRYAFEGFLSVAKGSRRKHLEEIKAEARTMVFYEAPHKLEPMLADLAGLLGSRRVAICRELTKTYEEVWRGELLEAAQFYSQNPARGEFVVIVEGAPPTPTEQMPLDDAVAQTIRLHESGISLSAAAKQVAADSGHKKSEIYRLAAGQVGG